MTQFTHFLPRCGILSVSPDFLTGNATSCACSFCYIKALKYFIQVFYLTKISKQISQPCWRACEFAVNPVQTWQLSEAFDWHTSPERWKIGGLVWWNKVVSGNQVSPHYMSDLITWAARKIKAAYFPLHKENPTEKAFLDWTVQLANTFQSIKCQSCVQRNPWHLAPATKGKLESVKILKRTTSKQRCSIVTMLTLKWVASLLLLSVKPS